jgi:hypothetical protein
MAGEPGRRQGLSSSRRHSAAAALRGRGSKHHGTRYLLPLLVSLGCGRDARPHREGEVPGPTEGESRAGVRNPGPQPHYLRPTVAFLMPEKLVRERVDMDSVTESVQRIYKEVARLYAQRNIPVAPLAIYLAAKPGKGMRAWAVAIDAPLTTAESKLIEKTVGSVPFPSVRAPIALSIVWFRDGAAQGAVPLPQPWSDASSKAGRKLAVPEELLSYVWPD